MSLARLQHFLFACLNIQHRSDSAWWYFFTASALQMPRSWTMLPVFLALAHRTERVRDPKRTMLQDQQRRYEKGQGLLEFALVLPFLLALVLGIVQAGLAIRAYLVINNSAREGARLASRGHWFNDAQVLTVINQNLARIGADSTNTTVVLTRAQSQPDTGTVTIKSQRALMGTEPSRLDATSLTTLHRSAVATAVAFPAFTPDPTIILYLNDEEIVIIEVLHHYHMSFGLTSIDLPMYSYALFRVSGGP